MTVITNISVMVLVYCQLVWIQSDLGNTSLGIYEGVSRDFFIFYFY